MYAHTFLCLNLDNDSIIVAGGNRLENKEFEYIGSKTNIFIPPLPRKLIRPTLLITNENQLMCITESSNKECYVLKNGVWTVHSILQEIRLGSTVVQMPNGIYILGGIFLHTQTSAFLPVNSNKWIEGPKAEVVNKNCAFEPLGNALKLNNEEFVFSSENIIFKYNVKTKLSNYYELQDKTYIGRASVLHHGKLMLTGGKTITNSEFSAETLLVDLNNGKSKYLGKLNIPRAMHKMEIILIGNQRKIISFGGENNQGVLNSVEIFNEIDQMWEISDIVLNQKRKNFSCVGIPSNWVL